MKQRSCTVQKVAAFVLLLAVAGGCDRPAKTKEADTPEARHQAAQRYMAQVPLSDTLEAIAEQLAAQREPAQRQALRELLRREIRQELVARATTEALVRHFTVAEINALAEFNARPEARSIQLKMPAYTADVVPPLRAEISRVLTMTNAALAALQWGTRVREFQASLADEQLVTDFPFVNRSDRVVKILAVTTTCGCLSGAADAASYPPRHSGYVRVTFDFGTRVGPQSKYVTVLTDDPAEPQVRLQVEVQIPQVLRIEPPFAFWQIDSVPTTKTNHVIALQPGLHFEGVTNRNDVFTVEWYSTPQGGEIWVTPKAVDARVADRLEVLVRVPSGVVRRFPVFVAVDPEKPPAP